MGAPIASGVPGEQVITTEAKRLASGAVGSIASNVLIDEYDMNPYIAMGIGMGISGLTYKGINSIEVDTTMGITASGGKGVDGVEIEQGELKTWCKKVNTKSADKVNQWWKDFGYDNPPYKLGTKVSEIELTQEKTFVRVYDGEISGMYGGWVMEADDIAGLTPAQIRDKFALPSEPKYIVDVKLTEGTRLRIGEANGLPGWGNGGGIQYDLMGKRIGEFVKPRKLE